MTPFCEVSGVREKVVKEAAAIGRKWRSIAAWKRVDTMIEDHYQYWKVRKDSTYWKREYGLPP